MVYAALFGIGQLCFGRDRRGHCAAGDCRWLCAALLYRDIAERVAADSIGGSGCLTRSATAESPAFPASGQTHAVAASFLGWTLDAFDFFVVVFLIDRLAAAFPRRKRSDHRVAVRDAGHAPGRRAHLRPDHRPLRPAHSPDGQRGLLFRGRAGLRVLAELHVFPGDARALRHRDGRRVGHRRVAGDGIGAAALARNSLRHPAERLFDRLPAGGDCGAFCAADVGLAADVLAGRHAGAAGVLHQRARAGIGSVEAASRAVDGRGPRDRRHAVEELSLSRAADDVHDVSLARHAGPLSRFPGHRAHTLGPAMQSYMAILYNVGAIVGAIIFGQFSDKLGRRFAHDRRAGACRCW